MGDDGQAFREYAAAIERINSARDRMGFKRLREPNNAEAHDESIARLAEHLADLTEWKW